MYPAIPDNIISDAPTQYWFTQTPHIPPNILMMKIIQSAKVRAYVGKIYEAIKFADEAAGEVKKNIQQTEISSIICPSIKNSTKSNNIPDIVSYINIFLHVTNIMIFLPKVSKKVPTANVLKKLTNDNGSIYRLICCWSKSYLSVSVDGYW